MTPNTPFSHPVAVAGLPEAGETFELAPDTAVREALARELGLIALPVLTVRLTVVPDGREGVHVAGRVDATVRQACVITLEPFDAPLREEVDLHFVPEERLAEPRPGTEVEIGAEDMPDPLAGGAVDLGAITAEFLALGIDPYPRKPGVQFEPPEAGTGSQASPFDVLAGLRGRRSRGKD